MANGKMANGRWAGNNQLHRQTYQYIPMRHSSICQHTMRHTVRHTMRLWRDRRPSPKVLGGAGPALFYLGFLIWPVLEKLLPRAQPETVAHLPSTARKRSPTCHAGVRSQRTAARYIVLHCMPWRERNTRTHMRVHRNVRAWACICTGMHGHGHACTWVCMCMGMYAHRCACAWACMCMCKRVDTAMAAPHLAAPSMQCPSRAVTITYSLY